VRQTGIAARISQLLAVLAAFAVTLVVYGATFPAASNSPNRRGGATLVPVGPEPLQKVSASELLAPMTTKWKKRTAPTPDPDRDSHHDLLASNLVASNLVVMDRESGEPADGELIEEPIILE
jgi:hypothetical protein